jgi:hypothetical protein
VSSSQWKIHFKSAPSEVYRAISTPLGRSRFWARSAKETNGVIHFDLPGGRSGDAPIERAVKDHLFVLRYFGRRVTFAISPDEGGNGTDLVLTSEHETGNDEWVSLLLRLKGHVDFGVDLRNHDETRFEGYVDGN